MAKIDATSAEQLANMKAREQLANVKTTTIHPRTSMRGTATPGGRVGGKN